MVDNKKRGKSGKKRRTIQGPGNDVVAGYRIDDPFDVWDPFAVLLLSIEVSKQWDHLTTNRAATRPPANDRELPRHRRRSG